MTILSEAVMHAQKQSASLNEHEPFIFFSLKIPLFIY